MIGGRGDDRMVGTSRNDWIFAGDGNDKVVGGAGHDVIIAGKGNDQIWGGSGDDLILGGSGADTITGGPGRDIIAGGSGADLILVHDGDWKSAADTDLLLSPSEDLIVFDIDGIVESVRFTAAAFARSAANEISGSVLTYAAIFSDGDAVADSGASLDFIGLATDPETLVQTVALVTPTVDAQAFAGVLGRVPSDDLEVTGMLFVQVTTDDGRAHSYATDFRGRNGDFRFELATDNGSSIAEIDWNHTGFVMTSTTMVVDDHLIA